MRVIAFLCVFAIATTLLASCSACSIEGDYAFSGTVTSGDCPKIDYSMKITHAIAGLDHDYFVQLPGFSGGCPGKSDGACHLDVDCNVVVTDAVDPNNATGTIQMSLTMGSNGFGGTMTLVLPATSNTPACSGTQTIAGSR